MEKQNKQELLEAYLALQEVIDKNKDTLKHDADVSGILSTIKRLNLEIRFGMPLSYCGVDWYQNYLGPIQTYVGYYGNVNGRRITWSDDETQPNEEWLYVVGFPTGPFIFGKEYFVETFQEFFNELKDFGPKYVDSNNQVLYFTEEVSKKVYDSFLDIFNKHASKVDAERKRMRKAELLKELQKLGSDET